MKIKNKRKCKVILPTPQQSEVRSTIDLNIHHQFNKSKSERKFLTGSRKSRRKLNFECVIFYTKCNRQNPLHSLKIVTECSYGTNWSFNP